MRGPADVSSPERLDAAICKEAALLDGRLPDLANGQVSLGREVPL